MSPRKKKAEAEGPAVPAYIVTFSDMVTLLLTFFVLLLSMSKDSDASKFKASQASFKRSITNFGLVGILYTLKNSNDFVDSQVSYSIKQDVNEDSSVAINSAEEQLRRLFSKLNDKMDVKPDQIKGKLIDLITPVVRFNSKSAVLTKQDRAALSEVCSELYLSSGAENMTVYVVGLAGDMAGRKKWITAAKRANAAAEFMRTKLSENFDIYNWGTANPSKWIKSAGSNKIQSNIIIAVLQ